MDLTSNLINPDSGCFEHSLSVVNSTPIKNTSRKRKRRHRSDIENDSIYLNSPQLSSTQKDIVSDFRELDLSRTSYTSTPEKQLKTNSGLSLFIVPSPIQESNALLYENIKNVKAPGRRSYPDFLSLRQNKYNQFDHRDLLNKITANHVIMKGIFRYLSNGDLYRLNQVSREFKQAIQSDHQANERLVLYNNVFHINKENYVITPPSSPDKCDSPPRTSSANLNRYIKMAKKLSGDQTLSTCRFCHDVAITENDVCQCQNTSCSIIYCLRCSSISKTGASGFSDKCGNSELQPLGNLSNFCDSGYNSSANGSMLSARVKRTLFAQSNSLKAVNRSSDMVKKTDRRDSLPVYYRVIPAAATKTNMTETGSESPPKISYGVCSKQSKKNLKRLTR